MTDTLIVIATNNGMDHLPNLLESMVEYPPHSDVCIIDTGSTDEKFIEYLQDFNAEMVIPVRFIKGGYCNRAFLTAVKNFPKYKNYIFLHDSMKIKSPDWEKAFTEPLLDDQVVAWLAFGMAWDNKEQEDYIYNVLGSQLDIPTKGIFGPIFSVKKTTLDKLEKKYLLPQAPNNKLEECGWERGWAIAFENAGVYVKYLNDWTEDGISFSGENLANDQYKYLTKVRPERQ